MCDCSTDQSLEAKTLSPIQLCSKLDLVWDVGDRSDRKNLEEYSLLRSNHDALYTEPFKERRTDKFVSIAALFLLVAIHVVIAYCALA
jgi:hypothetical protein